MKHLLVTIIAAFSFLYSWGNPNWMMHPNFDGEVENVIETPEFVYFTSRTLRQGYEVKSYHTLARYDKINDELSMLSTDNLLAFNTIESIKYNPDKGYLLVVYSNYDIDFLYDDGSVENLPSYRLASIDSSKEVNDITFYPEKDLVYLATNFGYVALNDEKYEIMESRFYDSPISSIARIGDYIYILTNDSMLRADASARRTNLSDYSTVRSFEAPFSIMPLSQDNALIFSSGGRPSSLFLMKVIDSKPSFENILNSNFYNPTYNNLGVSVSYSNNILQFYGDGSYETIKRPEILRDLPVATNDMKNFWHAAQRKGLRSDIIDSSEWTVTRDYMLPDAPAPFIATDISVHPKHGLMMVNYGFDNNFYDAYPHNRPLVVSILKNGLWKNYGPVYSDPSYSYMMVSPNGFAMDPDNPALIYAGSRNNGFLRINLDDPDDFIHLSSLDDRGKNLPGFVDFFPQQTGSLNKATPVSAPRFDASGNLWFSYSNYDNGNTDNILLYCWTPEERKKASLNSSANLPQEVKIKGYKASDMPEILPLFYSSNKNILLYAQCKYSLNSLIFIDTNGTPLDTSDDKVRAIESYYDNDGNSISAYDISALMEDPATGYIWVGHSTGVFYIDPREVLKGNTNVNRIKVARNDGTNLADYLLDGVKINDIAIDDNGRKWFATLGAGLICTSSDGREVIAQINTSNSPLPADDVFGLCYDSDSRSLIISTSEGLAQYFISKQSTGSNDKVVAFPNPVRPDYYGYVTIEGAPAGGLVKIADASGKIVKELGASSSSQVQWDVTNNQFKRVASGVYYILVSSPENSSSFSSVGKILVVN